MVSIKSIAVLIFAGLAVAAPAWEHPAEEHDSKHAGEPDRSMKGMCNQDQVVSCCNTGGLIAVPVGQCTANTGNSKFSIPWSVLFVWLTFLQLASQVIFTAARAPTTPT
jgi:hypothetical protein